MMNYIDLFAGAGGLSEGFIRTGFNPVAHVEMDKSACDTLKTRVSFHYLKSKNKIDIYNDYLKGKISTKQFYSHIPDRILKTIINDEISKQSLRAIFEKIDRIKSENNIKEIDLVIGGPPCQAYSLVGRARNAQKTEQEKKNDPRNYLYKQYVQFLLEYKPGLFVFENVPGLLNAGNKKYFNSFLKAITNADYNMEYQILDSSDYAVLQKRQRVFIIGWRKNKRLEYPVFEYIKPKYLVRSIFKDLPVMEPGETKNSYISSTNEYLKLAGIRPNGNSILTQNISRPHNQRDRKIYKIAIQLWNSKMKRLQYDDLPDKLKTHKNRSSFTDRFKVVASNMNYAHTVVAHIAKDGHYYIHPDINQCRSITVREAARLQSFSDYYYFEGSRSAIFRQIGNAVPVLMAGKIAEKIWEII